MPATTSGRRRTMPPSLGRVAWTRGHGCLPLAEVLADGRPVPVTDDLTRSCVADRIDLLVTGRASRFDLVSTVIPRGIDLDNVTAVTAAIGGGPNSQLAAHVAAILSINMGLPGELATVFRPNEGRVEAKRQLARLEEQFLHLDCRVILGSNAQAIIDTLSASTLLVVGAPGGSWLQRQIFGPGHRLLVAAPAGALVVKSAERRCFHHVIDPTRVVVSPFLALTDARSIVTFNAVPVASEGKLVGILRAAALDDRAPGETVADVMEPPVAVQATEPASAAEDLAEFLGLSPVPVIDHTGRLIGVIPHSKHQGIAHRRNQ